MPTQDGSRTRDVILGATVIGANYCRDLHRGTIQMPLKRVLFTQF